MRAALLAFVLGGIGFLAGCAITTSSSSNPLTQKQLVELQVTGTNGNLIVGQGQQMSATGTFSDKSTQDLTSSANWSSSDNSVASISTNGMVTANAAGTCTLTASVASIKGTFQLTVASKLVSIAVTPANAIIAPGTNQQFIATGTFSDGSKQNITGSVSWSSSNPAAVTISSTSPTQGLAHAVAGGNTTITATSRSFSAAASLTVTNATAIAINLTPAGSSLPLGLALQFTAEAQFSDNTTQDITDVATWTSSATSVASITVSGLATAKNIGSTTISAGFESVSGSTSLTVNTANLEAISITPADSSSPAGANVFFTATGIFNDGGTRNLTAQVTWSSSNSSVLTIGAGNAFAVAPGTVTLTATLGSVTGSTTFTVSNATIVSILITPATATIPTGGHVHFTATGVFSDSSTADVTTIAKWNSSNAGIATVGNIAGSFGTAVGVSAGRVTISATFSANGASATGSVPLTVDSSTLTGLSLQPGSVLVAPGSLVQYLAVGTFSDGSTEAMNQYATWSSSNNNVATVTAGGFATGQSAGSAIITAQSGGISATATLVVESSTLSSIQITPATISDPVAINVQFQAIGTFANGDTQDLTQAATWTSSLASVATISNAITSAGAATGIQPGTTTISAAFAGQVATAILTVTNATLESLPVTPADSAITIGASQQMSATGTFSDGSVLKLSTQVNWSSSNPGVATINGVGLASSVASGTTTIKATFDGSSGTAILTVQ